MGQESHGGRAMLGILESSSMLSQQAHNEPPLLIVTFLPRVAIYAKETKLQQTETELQPSLLFTIIYSQKGGKQ